MNHLKRTDEAAAKQVGDELLRSLAGYPTRSVFVARDQVRHRIVVTHRDQFGNVIGSVEHIEELDRTSLNGEFLD